MALRYFVKIMENEHNTCMAWEAPGRAGPGLEEEEASERERETYTSPRRGTPGLFVPEDRVSVFGGGDSSRVLKSPQRSLKFKVTQQRARVPWEMGIAQGPQAQWAFWDPHSPPRLPDVGQWTHLSPLILQGVWVPPDLRGYFRPVGAQGGDQLPEVWGYSQVQIPAQLLTGLISGRVNNFCKPKLPDL